MDLRQLEYFMAIAKEGSLTAAAKTCKIAQPSLSQQLRALEDELGEALVHRRHRGAELTDAGRVLLEHAERVLEEAWKLRQRFEQRRETQEGGVVFGMIPTIAPYLLPRILKPFRTAFPKVDVQIHEALTGGLIHQVVEGSIEFAIVSDVTPTELKKWSLHVKDLFREPLMLALPQGHPLARRKTPPRPDELNPADLIHLKDGHCLTGTILKVCRMERLNPGLECDQLETALAMVSAGMGIAVVPELATQAHAMKSVTFRKFSNPVPERTVSVMKRRALPLSKPAKELLNLIHGIPGDLDF